MPKLQQKLLQWVNLRPEESDRTFWMFAFYTVTSIGLVWLEASTVALFLQAYKAEEGLPWIYIASAGIGSGLGVVYSQLQRLLPLRRVIVIIAGLMALPLLLFWVGLSNSATIGIATVTIAGITVFLMRLWLEAIYVLNDLNTAITANQLFNIREIKRTFPLISSGILVADVISGFSLPLLTTVMDLRHVVLLAFGMMAIGAGILFYLSRAYWQAFPDSRRRSFEDRQPELVRRLQGPIRRYIVLLVTFFILAQVLFVLIDFQFLSQLQQQNSEEKIAVFLGWFNGTLGLFELVMQWLASSRMIERMGVFATAMLLPGAIGLLGATALGIVILSLWIPASILFVSLVLLKFLDELLHYTLFVSVGPVLFQPIPEQVRSEIQAVVRGIAEPLSNGATGLALLGVVWISRPSGASDQILRWLLPAIVVLALVWVGVIWLLREKYVGLLVMNAERGQLSGDVDLLELKRAVIEALDQSGTEAYKSSCIQLLSQLDPKNVSEVLAPQLERLSPKLQYQSLEKMMEYPNSAYLPLVQALISQSPAPSVLAVALRYVWITEENPDIRQLRPYLRPEVDPVVRGTAASLMLRRGNSTQKSEATITLRRMLTSKQEEERVMGCRALGEAVYLQALRLFIPGLLKDDSERVRRAMLEAIAATHLEEYYPSLLRGLRYKGTRNSAMKALVRLENDAIPMLVELGENREESDLMRLNAWKALGQIRTIEALDALINHLITAWGTTRRNILKILLEMKNEVGIEATLEQIGRSGVERMINQEIMLIGQTYAALLDLSPEQVPGLEADLLRRALRDLQPDAEERLFMLMKFLYPIDTIKAAAFSLNSHSRSNVAYGLEILDNIVDIPSKRALLSILDRGSDQEKLASLAEIVHYQRLESSDRLRHLLDLRHFLSDWALACCYHLARKQRWRLTPEQVMAGWEHPKGFVREAVAAYHYAVSPRTLPRVLATRSPDRDPLVAAQLEQMMKELSEKSESASRSAKPGNNGEDFPAQAGLEPI